MNNKIIIQILIIFLLTGFINNSYSINQYDTIPNNKQKIKYEIIRECEDSIKQDLKNQIIYLYGNSIVKYGSLKITASKIIINWKKNTISAIGTLDSLGNIIGDPILYEGEQSFKAKEIIYNLETRKCIVKNIIKQEGEGYIHGLKVKKMENDIMYLKKGEYTTCNAKHPHYSIRSNKIKIIPNEKIITGPAYLTIFNIPTPIFLPFGYFPNTNKKSSGIIIPSYGESANLGFFLKDGGYYFTLNNHMDLSIKGDIYTKGSASIKTNLRYKKRYKYNGNINLRYANIINSEKGFTDYSVKKDFFIRWNHQQDPKSNPLINFSANVNAGTSTFHRNNTFDNANDYLSNTFTSNINFTKRWEGTPFSLSSSLGHNQNTQTHIVNLTLPDITFSMNKIFPFKKRQGYQKKNWYDNIGIRYNLNTKNQVSTLDSLLFHRSNLANFRNGMRHNIPISASFKILKYFTFSQNINISERWYLNQINKEWNGTKITTDTIYKFTRGGDFNISSSINTKIYGVTQFQKGKIAAIRHVLTPNLSFNLNPGYGDERYGFYKSVQSDTLGNTQVYSIMENGIYGSPRKNRSGNITLNLSNIFGIKIRKRKDTINEIKKIQIIENLNINSSYNVFADSMKFSYINLNLRTKLFNKFNITYSAVFDPYIITENGRKNNLEILTNKRLARFKNSNTSISFNLNQKKKLKSNDNNKIPNEIPWNLNINYTHSVNKGTNINSEEIKNQTIGFSGNIKITPKWKIGFNSGYEFTDQSNQEWWKKFSYTSIDLYRDLHCWEMLFHWIPTGYQRSYVITIRVKADILKDLKLERRRDWIAPNFN